MVENSRIDLLLVIGVLAKEIQRRHCQWLIARIAESSTEFNWPFV